MHLAPKQIPVNAIAEIEQNIKKAEPKVDMIFLETASIKLDEDKGLYPKRIK